MNVRVNQGKTRYLLIVVVLIMTTACSQQGQAVTAPTNAALVTSTSQSTLVAEQPSASATVELSSTPEPSLMSTQIPQPTLTPTATPSSAAIITPTALPTLLPELIDERLSALMQPNEDCLLPCWWGIMPGKTTLQETDQILNSVGAASFSNHMFAIGGNGWGLGVNLTLDQEDIIQSIEITSTAAYADDMAKYWDDWQANSVAEVLRRNGVPSQVITYIPFQADAGSGQAYKLFLFYEEAGVMAEYTGYAESLDGSIYRVCPDLQRFTQIRLLLYRPEKVESMISTLFPPDQLDYLWSGITYDDITWEGITGTDLEAFHELFTSNEPDEACYEIPHIVDTK